MKILTTIVAGMAAVTLLAASASAADMAVQGGNFEQKKAEQLKRVDERITHLQEERTCIQSASNHDTLKACHEKFRTEIRQDKINRKK